MFVVSHTLPFYYLPLQLNFNTRRFIFQATEELILSDFTAASYGMLNGAARSILFPRVPNLPMVRALGKLSQLDATKYFYSFTILTFMQRCMNPLTRTIFFTKYINFVARTRC